MENRKIVSNVRALRERFELQAEENRSRSELTKSGSQTKLTSYLSSLQLNESSINSNEDEELTPRPLTSPNPRISIPLPLPSVLPTQVLKPRPFSYSEATGFGGSQHDLFSSHRGPPPPPPEKPPRTFLYDLLSDPPEAPCNLPQPPNFGVSLRRKTPLTATLSLPRPTQLDLEGGCPREERSHSIPVHRKAVYISDAPPIGVNKRKKKNKTIRSDPFLSSDHSTGDDCEDCVNWNGNGNHDPPYASNADKYLSATREMTRIREKQSQAVHKISTATIRPIQVSSEHESLSQFNGSSKLPHSPSPPPPPRLLRAKTEPDIISSSMIQIQTQRGWKPPPVQDSSDYGSMQGEPGNEQSRETVDALQRPRFLQMPFYSTSVQNFLNPYYYPRGLILGPDGEFSRQPIPPDHPNHFSVGILQNFQQFFESEDERNGNQNRYQNPMSSFSAADKYANFIRTYHPELEQNDQPALFYRQGTSVTVVPPWQQSNYLSKFCSSSPYQSNHSGSSSASSFVSPENGLWKNPMLMPPTTPPTRPFHGMSKSEWNLNEATTHDNNNRRHSNQNFITTKAVFSHGHHHQDPNLRSPRLNGFRPQTTSHQSIHSLVNQLYPTNIESVSGKDVTTSSTDSGIQLGTDSLSSCDTPLTGDSTTDTGDSDCENDGDTLEASRQVVEERKGYIRRVSSIRATEFLPLQRLLRNRPLPESLPPIEHGNERSNERALFDNLLVIGIKRDEKTGAYHPIIKYKFPSTAVIPDSIERFCFPDSLEWPCHEGSTAQFYTLTITLNDGSRKYGCMYRILPDGANICIPIAYCIISQTRAIGFYRNVLQILASRHGFSDSQMNFMINELYEEELPEPGKSLLVQDPISMLPTNSIDYGMAVPLMIRRKPDARLENTDLYLLLSSLDLSTVLKLFGSLLLERKIILLSKHLNLLSLCVEALESMLYPFSWQHTFVPILPLDMNELLEVPAPFVIGVLRSQVVPWDTKLDEGIVVDLDQRKILSCVGDEGSILPKRLYKKLREALHSVLNLLEQTENTRNVLISECFIRMFVETVGHYRTNGLFEASFYLNSDENDIPEMRVFKKDMFLKSVSSKSNRDFLDWFTETSMFQQFIECRKKPDFKPGLFEQRCMEQLELNKDSSFQSHGQVPWKNPSIISKGTAWFKGAFSKERE